MTVKELILLTASAVGIQQEVNLYFEGYLQEGEEEVACLLRCFNTVEERLALEYLPLITEEDVDSETGAVYFSKLSRSPVRILKVTDKWGNELPFKLFAEYIKTSPERVKVRYTYSPEEKDLDGVCDFKIAVCKQAFVDGMAMEYCLLRGLFEESAVWEKRFKQAIETVYRKERGSVKTRSRRWV